MLTPNVVLSDDGKGSIQAPWALIFDTAGNLWVEQRKCAEYGGRVC